MQREYLKALMLTMSATDSLLPRKLEIAERIVAQYSDHFVMQRQPAKGCHYHGRSAGRQAAGAAWWRR